MKSLIKFISIVLLFSLTKSSTAQYFASSYRPNSNTDKLVMAEIKALPEIQEWYETAKKSGPDLEIGLPDSSSKFYRIQVGISNFDTFRTNYWLYVDSKTLKIYYVDDMDESGWKLISLDQWRYWRSKFGFFKIHKWVNGKLVVLEDKKHDKTKSR